MQVDHEPANHRFVVRFPEGEGELVYRRLGEDLLELRHTGVDPALRGRGIADRLAETAIGWAEAQGLRIVPTCPFVQAWLQRHPGRLHLVAPRPRAKDAPER